MADFVETIVPKARGVGRVADNDKAIIVYFDRPLTDDEMRALSVIIDNGRNPANKNAGIRVGSDLHLCELLLAEIDELRKTLRVHALRRHVRMVSGGGEIPTGGSCEICKTEWREEQPEAHRASCLLAGTR